MTTNQEKKMSDPLVTIVEANIASMTNELEDPSLLAAANKVLGIAPSDRTILSRAIAEETSFLESLTS
jgi:hypothetical protein